MTFVQPPRARRLAAKCFLTPELKPFYGGTYFPPDQRGPARVFHNYSSRSPTSGETAKTKLPGPPPTSCPARSGRPLTRPREHAADGGRAQKRGRNFQAKGYDPRHGGSAAPPNFPSPPCHRCCCDAQSGSTTTKPRAWCCTPANAWPPAVSTTSWAAFSRVTRWMPNGSCRILRKCSTTSAQLAQLYLRRASSLRRGEFHKPLTLRAE